MRSSDVCLNLLRWGSLELSQFKQIFYTAKPLGLSSCTRPIKSISFSILTFLLSPRHLPSHPPTFHLLLSERGARCSSKRPTLPTPPPCILPPHLPFLMKVLAHGIPLHKTSVLRIVLLLSLFFLEGLSRRCSLPRATPRLAWPTPGQHAQGAGRRQPRMVRSVPFFFFLPPELFTCPSLQLELVVRTPHVFCYDGRVCRLLHLGVAFPWPTITS